VEIAAQIDRPFNPVMQDDNRLEIRSGMESNSESSAC